MIEERHRNLLEAIRFMDEAVLRGRSSEELSAELQRSYQVDVPRLIAADAVRRAPVEVPFNVSQEPGRHSRFGGPILEHGTELSVEVPFEGDGALFGFVPLPSNAGPHGQTIVLRRHVLRQAITSKQLTAEFNNWIVEIDREVKALAKQAEQWNDVDLPREIRQGIERRRGKLRKDDALAEGLGYPLRRHTNADAYAVPLQRRPLATVSVQTPNPGEPDHILGMREYEEVLGLLHNMGVAIERSPHIFHRPDENDEAAIARDEERLRDFMLVMLNAVFQGQATGETFNREGKTDILVRVGGQNVFIGECKIWNGAKSLASGLDQLLGYSCWRDSKVALLVFSRRKGFEEVVKQIGKTVHSHTACVSAVADYKQESAFRFEIQHPEHQRKMILTAMAFDLFVGER